MRFCPNCGIPVGESPRYCAGCGTQVTPVPVASAPAGAGLAGAGLAGAVPTGAAPAERGPFGSAPLRLDSAGRPPAATVSVAESLPSEAPGTTPALGMRESWLPEELAAARSGEPGTRAGVAAGDPWAHHDLADPWAPMDPAASLSTPPTWFDALSPGGHPQAGGSSGAAPAARSRRAAPGRRRRPAWSGHRMTITAMVVTLGLVGTAGVAAWQVSQLQGTPSPAPSSMNMPRDGLMSGTGNPGSTQPAAHGSPAPLPRTARSTAPSVARPNATPAPAGNAVVAVGPQAAGAPQVRLVVALLTTYFESINNQNFAEYQSLFVPSIQRMMTHFGSGYAGTFDSGATLTQLVATGPHGLAATVAFISHQNPANSPDGASCDSWLITLFLKQQSNALHIRHPRPGFPQSVLSCG
jgi:hypothetical protein